MGYAQRPAGAAAVTIFATLAQGRGSAMTRMKAVRMHEYGGPEVLQVEVVPRPSASAGEILVRVHASGVNPIDWKVREGYLRHAVPLRLPAVLGVDFSGVVEAAGQGVK